MYLEFKHLRSIKAIHDCGGLARAASNLNMTQSALSHQIKGLENQTGLELFVRRSKPLKLSKAGHKLLILADHILPKVSSLEQDLKEIREGRAGRLHIAIECHACFEWLFPVLEKFRKTWPDIDVDIRPGLNFDAFPALEREEIDLVISGDPEDLQDITFSKLFSYESQFLASSRHPLAKKKFIVAEDLRDETLLTYPVDKTKLDAYTELLTPAGIEPKIHRTVELTAVILLLVASNRGVTVLPDWVVDDQRYNHDYVTLPITKSGVKRNLYAATRTSDLNLPFINKFIEIARQIRK